MQELSRLNNNHALPAQPSESSHNDPFASSEPDDQSDLWAYWSVIWRHLGLILKIFVVAELLTAVAVFSMTPLYSGISTILIERQASQALENNPPNEPSETEFSSESFYKTQYEILRSRSLAAQVIHEMRLDHNRNFAPASTPRNTTTSLLALLSSKPKPSSDDHTSAEFGVSPQLVDIYLERLAIRPEYGTRLVTVAFTSPDPALSAAVANAHVQAYILQASQRHAQSSEAEQRFLEKKLIELERRIEKSETALNDYRRQRGIVVFSPDDSDKDQMASLRMAELNRALVQAAARRISLQADIETINVHDYDSLPTVVHSVLIQNLKSETSKLEGEYASMANQFTPEWPPAAQLRAQLLQAREQEQKEIGMVVDSMKLDYRSALDQENRLQTEFKAEKAKAMSLKDASLRDVILSREVDTNRALYKNVLERIKVLGMASESRVTNVSIIDLAGVPEKASSPRKRLSAVLSGFLALLLGLAAAFTLESRDQGLKNSDDVQRYLRLPNLATVLYFDRPSEKSSRAKRLFTLSWSRAAQPANEQDGLRVRALLAAAGDAYRAVRTGILLSRSGTPPKTVLVTSATSGEGKSLTAVNTAIVLAQMVDRVLLIDADLRQPRCHTALNRDNAPGLTEVLTGHADLANVIQPTNVEGLYLLSAGLTPPNPTELLGSSEMRGILAAAEASFQHVLIDAAPVLPVSDSVLLSSLVDGVVIVANAQTARPLVRDACSRLTYVGAKLLGVVLNKVNPQDQRYRQSYTYQPARLDT